MNVDLSSVPRHWMAGNAVATAISNGINLLFPHGERFFVRSVNHYIDEITDPVLRDQVRSFFKQEGAHAKAHDTYNEILREQGYEIDNFLSAYRAIVTWLERHNPPVLNLAITAASEHFTAILADGAFTEGMLDEAAPTMRQLLAWHAAEEIEHKAVAFDVLQQVNPSYAVRMAGLAYATVTLGAFWAVSAALLLRQERKQLGRQELRRQARALRDGERKPIFQRVFLAGIREYIRRDFHPNDKANENLAAEWFARRAS